MQGTDQALERIMNSQDPRQLTSNRQSADNLFQRLKFIQEQIDNQ